MASHTPNDRLAKLFEDAGISDETPLRMKVIAWYQACRDAGMSKTESYIMANEFQTELLEAVFGNNKMPATWGEPL